MRRRLASIPFMLFLFLAAAQLTITPPAPRSPAELRSEAASVAWGECLGTASLRLAGSESDDAILLASFGACRSEEAAATTAYEAYLRSIGLAPSAEEMQRIFAEGRVQIRPRLTGCIAESRARKAGRAPRPC